MARLREWARVVKREVFAVWLATRDPRVPWYAKVLAAISAGYALSPIDLIPDFIPVLGLLDDLILVPFGLWVTVRLIPADVMQELRIRAAAQIDARPNRGWIAAIVIVSIWIASAAAGLLWAVHAFHSRS